MAVGKGSYDLTRILMALGLMALVPLAWAHPRYLYATSRHRGGGDLRFALTAIACNTPSFEAVKNAH